MLKQQDNNNDVLDLATDISDIIDFTSTSRLLWAKLRLFLNSIQQSENWEVCSYKSMNWRLNVPIEDVQVGDSFYWTVYSSHSYVLYKPEEIGSILISGDQEEIERLNADLRRLKQNIDRGLLVESTMDTKVLFERFGKRDYTTLL